MAGGGGTRFWPSSRKTNPKQLLNLSGKDVMINETIARIRAVADKENLYVVTNDAQADKLKSVVGSNLSFDNVISEPCARNTAACIGFAAVKILKEKGDGVMVVTPSDAYVKDEPKYAEILQTAIDAAKNEDCIVTVGIEPTFPATGYGYIKYEKSEKLVKKVESFVEKPDLETAEKYVKSGNYVWNGGIFVWKASVVMANVKRFLPDLYDGLMRIYDAIGTEKELDMINSVYPELPSVSIDYGVMEKASDVKVVTGEFGWNDVGSWDMLGALHASDDDGNVTIGDCIALDTVNSTIVSSGRLVAVLGMEGVTVVETPDAILVCPKEKAQDVKKIVDVLKEKKRCDLL